LSQAPAIRAERGPTDSWPFLKRLSRLITRRRASLTMYVRSVSAPRKRQYSSRAASTLSGRLTVSVRILGLTFGRIIGSDLLARDIASQRAGVGRRWRPMQVGARGEVRRMSCGYERWKVSGRRRPRDSSISAARRPGSGLCRPAPLGEATHLPGDAPPGLGSDSRSLPPPAR